MTMEEAKTAIENHLKGLGFKEPKVSVALGASHGMQLVRGEHLVRPDGTISLGSYGEVRVAGMTVGDENQRAVKSLAALQSSIKLCNRRLPLAGGATTTGIRSARASAH